MSVYRPKRADGTREPEYIYDFRSKGRRFSGSTGQTDRREAEKFEKRLREKLKSEEADRKKPLTFRQAVALYWSEVGQFHRNVQDTERALAWLTREIGGATPIASIGNRRVAELVAKRRSDQVANKTVNLQVIEPLRGILRRADEVWEQKVQRIEWKRHTLPVKREHVREATAEEEQKLRAAVRPDYRHVIDFAFLTGCRMAEIVGLIWKDVDFFNKEFTVTGKGDKARTLPMTRPIFELLWAAKDHHPTAVFTFVAEKTRDIGGERRVRGRRYPVTYDGLKTEWRRAREDSGVENFRFHDMRHTAASRVARATGDLRMVRDLLGHEEIATTMRYAHLTKKDLRAGLEAAHARHYAENAMENTTNSDAKAAKLLIKNKNRR
ncbi:tyrosine-type recombinase/integrase [Oricola indica]|jgi:integrase|uniref:tyrosine-type recombinase/integrase n=1 Tax=Oricola indica TaxID=2872591 RepID=UPI001CBAEE1A|nr:tyrosine-type recombinase/integrase [Oricola indica]